MKEQKIAEKLAGHFDNYEILLLKERTKKYESRDKGIYGVELKEEEGMALRAIRDGKMVFGHTYGSDEEGADRLIETARALLPVIEADEDLDFPGPYTTYPVMEIHDARGLETAGTEKVSRLKEMEGIILDSDSRIVATRNCELQETEVAMTLINSRGLRAEGRKSLFSVFALCVARDADDEVSCYDWSWAYRFQDLAMPEMGRSVAAKTLSYLSGVQLDTGLYDGILTTRAACDILDVLSGSFLGESLFKNKTRLAGKIGEACFSEQLSIRDSGFLGAGAFPFDGEGVPSRETVLVENGRFRGFLYDRYYGRKAGVESTGNGVRGGIKDLPQCGVRGLYIRPGSADLWGSFAEGIIIDELMGVHTANPVTGDFSLGAVGHMRRQGEDIPFKGVIFSGNVFELLRSVTAVGTDLRFYGTTGAPSLFVEGLKISGK
jgi:PmbA protein